MADVGQWLAGIGLDRYAATFEASEIRADVLVDLTDADLQQLGIPLGDRKRLLKAIVSLAAQPAGRGSPRPQSSRRGARQPSVPSVAS